MTTVEVIDWEELAGLRERQAIALRDQINRMSVDRSQWQRDTQAQLHHDVWRDLLRYANGSVRGLVAHHVDGLVHMVVNLPDKVSAAKRQQLIDQARLARTWLDDIDTTEADGQLVEVGRLRAALSAQGARLHAEYGAKSGRCECPGCELTRTVEAGGVPL